MTIRLREITLVLLVPLWVLGRCGTPERRAASECSDGKQEGFSDLQEPPPRRRLQAGQR